MSSVGVIEGYIGKDSELAAKPENNGGYLFFFNEVGKPGEKNDQKKNMKLGR